MDTSSVYLNTDIHVHQLTGAWSTLYVVKEIVHWVIRVQGSNASISELSLESYIGQLSEVALLL